MLIKNNSGKLFCTARAVFKRNERIGNYGLRASIILLLELPTEAEAEVNVSVIIGEHYSPQLA